MVGNSRSQMKNHVSVYLKSRKLTTADVILCEQCHAVAVDIHHIKFRSRCGRDVPENLIALCRKCHALAHGRKEVV